MKIISKIKIHPFFYIVTTICLFTGNIRDFLVFSAIIIVHELGHIIGALIYKWNIEKIIILPFGGLTIFKNKINTSLKEQAIITILGPLFQILFYYFTTCFYSSPRITYYNFLLLFFNLLPIYPLDGSKLLYIILNLLLPFKMSYLITLFISFLTLLALIINLKFDLIKILTLLFLIIKTMKALIEYKNIFNKFLFERYLYSLNFKKVRYIKKISNMYLWCRHIFIIKNQSITEKNILAKKFDIKTKL